MLQKFYMHNQISILKTLKQSLFSSVHTRLLMIFLQTNEKVINESECKRLREPNQLVKNAHNDAANTFFHNTFESDMDLLHNLKCFFELNKMPNL